MQLPRPGSGSVNVTSFQGQTFRGPDFLRAYEDIPGRTDTRITMFFDQESQQVLVTVTQGPECNALLRCDHETLEFAVRNTGWKKPEDLPSHLKQHSVPSTVCYLTYMMSGYFCGRQAWTDWEQHQSNAFWAQLIDDAKHMYCAAVVMLG